MWEMGMFARLDLQIDYQVRLQRTEGYCFLFAGNSEEAGRAKWQGGDNYHWRR
jgi:hypothetical protein